MKFIMSPGKRYTLFIALIRNEYEGLSNVLWLYDRKKDESSKKIFRIKTDFAFLDYQKSGILKLIKNGNVERRNLSYKALFAR